MGNGDNLSGKGQKFIEDLRVYLFSSGRNSDETEEIIEELEIHLIEAERKGKPIERIIGDSPKAYMQSIAGEMAVDYKTWFKYILIIVLGSFSFTIVEDLMEGSLAYSVLEMVGHVVIGIIFIGTLFVTFRFISGKDYSSMKKIAIILIPAALPIVLFIGLIYLNRAMETPVIHFGFWGSFVLALLTLVFLISISVWAKSWIVIFLVILLTLPDYLLSLTPLQEETQSILGMLILIGCMGIYLWTVNKLEKKEG